MLPLVLSLLMLLSMVLYTRIEMCYCYCLTLPLLISFFIRNYIQRSSKFKKNSRKEKGRYNNYERCRRPCYSLAVHKEKHRGWKNRLFDFSFRNNPHIQFFILILLFSHSLTLSFCLLLQEATLASSINRIPLSFPIQGQGTNGVDQKSVYGGVILPEPHLCAMVQTHTLVKNENMQ